MSAYIIDDETYISLYYYLLDQEYYHCHTYGDLGRANRIKHFISDLRTANYHSVDTRYKTEKNEIPLLKITVDPAEEFSHIQACKTLASIDYQSCEFEEWTDTQAWAGLQEASAHAASNIVKNLPEYRATVWP